MQITKENITFIDNYLQKSNVDHFDVRMELTDHVASAIEEKMILEQSGFYDAFKNYMSINKKELLYKNTNTRQLYKKVMSEFFHTNLHWYNLALLTILFAAFYAINKGTSGKIIFTSIIQLQTIVLILLFFLSVILRYFVFKQPCFFLFKNNVILFLWYLLNSMLNGYYFNFRGNYISLCITTFVLLIFINYFMLNFIKFKKLYQQT